MKERVETLIAQAGPDAFFTGGVAEDRVRQVEELLGVCLPESYRWFLRRYGYGGVSGVEILGVGKSEDPPAVVQTTCDCRQVRLPHPYVVVSDHDEWQYCLQTDLMAVGECPVVDWSPVEGVGTETYPDFLVYLLVELERRLTRK